MKSLPFRTRRILSFLVDLILPIILVFILKSCFIILNYSFPHDINNWIRIWDFLTVSLLSTLLFCKDLISGRSIGKRIFGIQIIETSNSSSWFEAKLILRNITLIIFPIELIFILVKPSSRIGDSMLDLQIKSTELIEITSKKNPIVPFLGIAFIIFIIGAGFYLTDQKSEMKPILKSYNRNISTELKDELKKGFENQVSVKVYDKSNRSNTPFLSIAIYLQKEDLNYEDKYDKIMMELTEKRNFNIVPIIKTSYDQRIKVFYGFRELYTYHNSFPE